jgi:hypothetical protein
VSTVFDGSLVHKRAGREQANAAADLWKGSISRYHERKRRRARAAWYAFHLDLADSLRRSADEHEAKAWTLLEEPNRGGGVR